MGMDLVTVKTVSCSVVCRQEYKQGRPPAYLSSNFCCACVMAHLTSACMRSITTVACTCKNSAHNVFADCLDEQRPRGQSSAWQLYCCHASLLYIFTLCQSVSSSHTWLHRFAQSMRVAWSAAWQAFKQTALTAGHVSLVNEYLGFAHKKWHENCSDAFLEDDGENDAAGHIDQHHSHPHTPAVTHVEKSDNTIMISASCVVV